MSFSEHFKQSLFKINEKSFADSSLLAFDYQYHHCEIYRQYCDYLKRKPSLVRELHQIPFLPIEFYKNHAIKSGRWQETKIFKSSGTTKTGRSYHYIKDEAFYHELSLKIFETHFDSLDSARIIAILPSYLEQGDSSLISMVDYFIKLSGGDSGYYLNQNINDILNDSGDKIIIGVSYALLELASQNIGTQNAQIIETGGMKGRRKEITRAELHESMKNGFNVKEIWSEYGMTELLSQAYAIDGSFRFPPWAKALIRDINDPFNYLSHGRSGGINLIDLANIDSCCFIETKDLGRSFGDHFEVLGRFDNSDIRGCNLLV